MNSICIFCGSNPGERAEYLAAAIQVGTMIARQGMTLVYGGAQVGLMGAVADAALSEGGRVVGVIPRKLGRREIAHTSLTELHFVDTMHERKALMTQLSQGFMALPGGYGTLDELFECLTWTQLGIHEHPIGLLNILRFFDPLLSFLNGGVTEKFLRPEHRAMLLAGDSPESLLEAMRKYRRPSVKKWMGPGSE